ncbi:MAG: mannose-1-phosphate guanylyltransferase [Paludibacteraceae bacterium]|nr:mannose-1-phosphate guanylyltransferase [Paludibacteraceae bacterium]MBR6043919.1 mannose-1-phosphate guanylyltransferase [Paludibacteraceae bacterium]
MTQKNYCVIMAGGVGSRFWPFSTSKRPKQFLDLFGTGRTLIQMTYDRMRKVIPAENIFIASNSSYRDLILEQLPEIKSTQLLLEPARRNTAPCIAYATYKIASLCHDANVVVAASDHLILKEDEFVQAITKGLEHTSNHNDLLTLGIKPSRPETGYGYIQTEGESDNGVYKVKTFTEKPNLEMAKIFIESGDFLWNSGMFIWNVRTISEAFDLFAPEMALKFRSGMEFYNTPAEQGYIDKIYQSCTNKSIDYVIMEKAKNVKVIEADFGWSDLGTWGSLYELSDKDEEANVRQKGKLMLYDCKDNIITLPEGKLAVIQGAENFIIAETDNVLLICKKDQEQRIRDFVNETKVQMGDEFV